MPRLSAPAARRRRLRRFLGCCALAALPGCAAIGVDPQAEPELSYVGEANLVSYEERGPKISYPTGVENDVRPLLNAGRPRTVEEMAKADVWDLPLEDAVKIALSNSDILRTLAPRGQVTGVGFNTAALANPDFAPSLFDPAIAQTGVLFGNRGVEAALADFDAQLHQQPRLQPQRATRDDRLLRARHRRPARRRRPRPARRRRGRRGSRRRRRERRRRERRWGGSVAPFVAGETATNTAAFQSAINKTLATGGTVSAFHNVNYLSSDPAFGAFPSSYDNNVGLRFTQPLLAGSGVEYTRIAGPRNPGFSAITGVNQGVVIARINEDINLIDFERNVRDTLKSVEDAYWSLYNAYRQYDTSPDRPQQRPADVAGTGGRPAGGGPATWCSSPRRRASIS